MVDDGLRRARRNVKLMLYATLAIFAFIAVIYTLAGLAEGTRGWVRAAFACAGLVVFSWLYVRIVNAVLDHRYARRDVVMSGAVALAVALVDGVRGMGWLLLPLVWLSVAALGVRRRTAFALAAGTAAVLSLLAVTAVLAGSEPLMPVDTTAIDDATRTGMIVGMVVAVVLNCGLFPWANRLWVWIWRLAEEAHAGREARARLAVAEERLRFARDLHDLVGHQLSAIAVKSELAVRLSAVDATAAGEEMSSVRGLARTALRELREAVSGYRRPDLTAELGAVRGALEAGGVGCHLHLPYREVPDDVAPVFAWVVREAATNVLRHSSATRCDILVRHSEKEAVLEVRNDGVAQDAPGVGKGGNGLTGLTERMAEIGGTLTARPTGSGEFTLRAVAPLPVTRARGEAPPAASADAAQSAEAEGQIEVRA
ncbi:histidine kinase [Microbispora sp. NPDC088329]|uniref:sensor histidine kinase n=1 Tax=Microbispora sp. NPDC088329 TaxID=3154869 RepID=UPI0034385716